MDKAMLFRDKKGRLLAGLQLGNQISQLSYCFSDHLMPETVSLVDGEEQYAIPTVLAKRMDVNQWFFGKDALSKEMDVYLIQDLLRKATEAETEEVGDEAFPTSSLLALFVKRCLSLVSFVAGGENSDYLMITCECFDERMTVVMGEVMEYLGMDREHFFFQGQEESFYQYVMHQSADLRGHDLLLLNSANGLSSLRMEMNLQTVPMVSFITQQTHDAGIMEPLPQDENLIESVKERKDEKLLAVLKELCENRIVKAVFLVGEGFGGEWMRESLRYMCSNKRVFQGNNLFSKGACYGVCEKVYPGEASQKFLFLGRDKVKSNVGVLASVEGGEQYVPLLDAGVNWFDVQLTKEFILDDEATITFVITPLNGKEKRRLNMVLQEFPQRPPRTSRIRLSVSFENEENMKLRVEDLGFGEFFKATEYVVEDVIEV